MKKFLNYFFSFFVITTFVFLASCSKKEKTSSKNEIKTPKVVKKETQKEPIKIDKPPKIIKKVIPEYPKVARQARIARVVTIEITEDENGKVIKTKVLKGHPLLNDAAVKAVKQWKFEPFIIDGNPSPVKFTIKIKFVFK